MLTKEYINDIKSQGNGVFAKVISERKDISQICRKWHIRQVCE